MAKGQMHPIVQVIYSEKKRVVIHKGELIITGIFRKFVLSRLPI
jgi:hypothetical protein